MITVKSFVFSPFQENTYILHDETNEAVIIDPGCFFEGEKLSLKKYIDENKLTLKRVLNTHLHLDHQFGNKYIYDTFGVKPEACKNDEFLLHNISVKALNFGLKYDEIVQEIGFYITDNQIINFGNTLLTALFCPGHSQGSMVFYCEKDNVMFAGDVLFRGSIGRTDLEQGDYAILIKSITNKLLPLPDSTIVYSGHGPSTTIGYEKVNNPYL